MKTTFIYTLTDPLIKQVRYVGKSNNPTKRLEVHLSKNNIKSHKTNWIQSLLKINEKPILEIIDEVDIKEWKFWEVYWISQFKSWGFNLTNSTCGGDGCTFSNITSFDKGHIPWNKGKKGYNTSKRGHKVPKSIKIKISKTLTGRESLRKRPVIQLTKNMEVIKEYDSVFKARQETGIKSISHVLTGRRKTAGGFIWQYKNTLL